MRNEGFEIKVTKNGPGDVFTSGTNKNIKCSVGAKTDLKTNGGDPLTPSGKTVIKRGECPTSYTNARNGNDDGMKSQPGVSGSPFTAPTEKNGIRCGKY